MMSAPNPDLDDRANQACGPRLSVVVPVYNEAAVLTAFSTRLTRVLNALSIEREILYIDDGSTDSTGELLTEFQASDPRVGVVRLSRNFGKEVAISAGLDYARGAATIIIDADLQDPPELIPQLIAEWENGYDVVYAHRRTRPGESWLKRSTASAFYGLMRHVGTVRLPENAGDYRLLSRRAVDAVKQFREHHRFMKGLFSWIGYRQKAVDYDRDPRFAGDSKWSYYGLWNLAVEGITSFTVRPLKLATYLGLATAMISFLYGGVIIAKTLVYGRDLPGYASLMVVILFLGGVELCALGVIGEYLGRTFNEAKRRPLYFVESFAPGPASDCRDADEVLLRGQPPAARSAEAHKSP